MSEPEKILNKRLGEILIARGLISAQQLDEALDLQKKDGTLIGETLVRLKYVTEEVIAWALTVQYGFPYLPLAGYEINKEVITIISHDFARQNGVIGIDKVGSVLTIAMSNPLNHDAIQELEEKTRCKIQIFISTLTEVQEMILKHYSGKGKP